MSKSDKDGKSDRAMLGRLKALQKDGVVVCSKKAAEKIKFILSLQRTK